jgi:hypothetical protein
MKPESGPALFDRLGGFPTKAQHQSNVERELTGSLKWHVEMSREFGYRNRGFIDGLPPLREFVEIEPGPQMSEYPRRDPFRSWVKMAPRRSGESLAY